MSTHITNPDVITEEPEEIQLAPADSSWEKHNLLSLGTTNTLPFSS